MGALGLRILVTGAEGFVGRHLLTELRAAGHEAFPTSKHGRVGHRLALPDDAEAQRLLSALAPDAVVHLAAISSVGAAARDVRGVYETNVRGTRSLVRAMQRSAARCRLLLVSSASVYGEVTESSQPIREEHPPIPGDVYGWTKLAAESLTCLTSEQGDAPLRCTIVRTFNHTGPGQSSDFVLSSFARQIAAMERREQPARLRTGNLDVARDFLDVRDVVRAYRLLIEADPDQETLNVSSGIAVPLREIVQLLQEFAQVRFEIEREPARVRARDIALVAGDSGRLRRLTGWAPCIALRQTLQDLLADWRTRPDGGVPA